jgi:uncharacterized protein (TIGR02996 family)
MAFRDPDWLLMDGQRRMLLSHPLDRYLRELPSQPDFRISAVNNTHGYVATWEVREDHTLWLIHLQTRPAEEPDPGIRLVFPGATGPVFAEWVAQELRSSTGDQRRYSPREGWTFARETYLTVWRGRVVLVEEATREGRVSEMFTPHLESIFGSEEAAFLRAAHANPDDSAPRLVYADWLDERGDPRGEAVRLAERMRGLDPAALNAQLIASRDVLRRSIHHELWLVLMGYKQFLPAL